MTKPSPRAVAAPSPARILLAATLTTILPLGLLLAPRLGHAAPAPSNADLAGSGTGCHITDQSLERP